VWGSLILTAATAAGRDRRDRDAWGGDGHFGRGGVGRSRLRSRCEIGAGTADEVFFWISNISSVSTLVVWCAISVTYLRFRAGLKYHGIDRNTLSFKSPLQPFLAWFSICFCSIVAFFNGFDCFFPGNFSAKTFVPPYIDIPIVMCLFFGYKFIKKTKFVRVHEMDLWTDKAEIDAQEPYWPVVEPKNWLQRIWFWIA